MARTSLSPLRRSSLSGWPRIRLQSALVLTACCLVLGCNEYQAGSESALNASSEAVTNSSPAPSDGAVVGLAAANYIYCTGVLVGPRAVLTAAHCIRAGRPEAIVVQAKGESPKVLPVLESWQHPRYRSEGPNFDVGILLSGESAEAPWVTLPALPSASLEVGTELRIVGYGQTEISDDSAPKRQQGTAIVTGTSPGTLSLGALPSLACAGDSGGPVFATIAGEEALVGVVSHGDEACSERTEVVRPEAHFATFLGPLLADITRSGAVFGERCYDANNCASGLCLSPDDAPDFAYCSQPCVTAADCLTGTGCEADVAGRQACRLPLPSPGALGSRCTSNTECQDGLCASPDRASPRICSKLCFSDALTCASGSVCAPTAEESRIRGCFPKAGAPAVIGLGCALSHFPSGSSQTLLEVVGLVGIVAALRGARRRVRREPSG